MNRKVIGLLGILLIVVGVISLVWGGIQYTSEEQVIELGGVEVEAETEETVPLPPILGGVALVGGIVLVVISRKP